MEHLEAHRTFFARLITASVGIPGGGGRLAEAFAATPRERFVGPGPWRVFTAGARDDETAQRLTEAFKRDDLRNVQSLRRGTPPDETCWCAGSGWWLSTALAA